ncbi:MAG: hypothetical protein GEU82_04630 [Luteitalea sp.]|nr:hypothetical protein [Luteitalea sp.]
MEVVNGFRSLIIVLLGIMCAGQALLDACVFGCHTHPQVSDTKAASCHDAPASSAGALWQSTSTCNHDHGELSADVAPQAGPDRGLKAVTPAIATRLVSTPAHKGFSSGVALGQNDDHQPRSSAFLSPLRV